MQTKFLLYIDTATNVCSVAISRENELIRLKELDEPNVHASMLTGLIADGLAESGLSLKDIAAIVVSKGPGSYTGLRIGISTAKGLCYALDIPLIAVDTLDALFDGYIHQHILESNIRYFPMLDARRMEVYTAEFDGNSQKIQSTKAEIVDEHSFEFLTDMGCQVRLFGPGADKLIPLFAENAKVDVVPGVKCSASFLIKNGWERYINEEFEDVAYFEPFYLKDFVASTPKKKD